MNRPIPNSYWVSDNRLLAGEYPGAWDAAEARDKLGRLLDAGIRSFVDLTESHELVPYAALLTDLARERGLDVRYRRMSIADLAVPTVDHMTSVLHHIEHEVAQNRPCYVHCWGGIGRTGTTVGCWFVASGISAEDAIDRIADLRRDTPAGRRASPETQEQRDFISAWQR